MIVLATLLSICPPGPRDNCVVDGDTFWLEGEKIRIADIDAPEMRGRCEAELELAVAAKDRLLEILNSEDFRLERRGRDRYGRTLAVILNSSGSVGNQLVSEGLARTWDGKRRPWC